LAAAFFLVLYGLFRFSPYGDLRTFLERPHSTRFYDRWGNLVQIVPLDEGLRREYADPESLPPALEAVFLCAEDERFYGHPGIDPLSVLRAAYQNIRGGRRVSGASTITMQLARIIAASAPAGGTGPGSPAAKAAAGSPRRGLAAKAAEALNALRLEARFSKGEILSLYLNSIPFGFQTEGIASAARNFFSAEVSFLSPAETFCLAVIPRRPAAYNPLSEKAACVEAARTLAARFARDPLRAAAFPHYASLTGDDWESVRPRRFRYPNAMPYLVRHVQSLPAEGVKKAPDFGVRGPGRRAGRAGPVSPADYTLAADPDIQRLAEELLASNLRRHAASRLSNGAAVVIDHRTGEVIAWAGASASGEGSGIDGVLVRGQMGSAMKPFLYALALEKGRGPADVLADIPSSYGGAEVYIPRNFNNRFNGPVLFRTALASSLNIPAVDLLYRLGVRNYAGFLSELGFTPDSEEMEEAGLGLALGNVPVSLVELAAAFSVFPRDGLPLSLRFDRADDAASGSGPAEKNAATGRNAEKDRVMSADTARIICSILSDRRARRLGFGAGRGFETPFPAIFKTGTANQYQSIAALGATSRYTAAVWMGNFSGETVMGRTGSSLPAAVVRSLLLRLQGVTERGAMPGLSERRAAVPGRQEGAFREPEKWRRVPVCALSGMTPSAACPSVIEEYQTLDWNGAPCTWHGSASRVIYPPEYQGWFLSLPREGELDYSAGPLEISSPRNGSVFFLPAGGGGSIPVEVIGGAEDELTVEYGGETFTVTRPFVFFLPYRPGVHTLRVSAGGESDEVEWSAR
jgi:penicillin-binding protein 1C